MKRLFHELYVNDTDGAMLDGIERDLLYFKEEESR